MANGRLLMVETPDGLRKRAFGGDVVEVCTRGPADYRTMLALRQLPMITGPVNIVGDNSVRLTVADSGAAIPAIVSWAAENNVNLESVEPFEPPLDDVFVELVKREAPHAA
jgi:ABC-2 type transport system ATP-binding protein